MILVSPVNAASIRLAVASNFTVTAHTLAPLFEKKSGHSLSISSSSSGKHFTQIRNGAPFDIFLAADSARPELLEQSNQALADSRFTYAVGKLVVWSAALSYLDSATLTTRAFRRLAIANPRHAPYGLAAKQTLQALDLWSVSQDKLLRAENVNQAFQFVATQNAELGFASLAQLRYLKEQGLFKGSYWLVPNHLYSPIQQQLVILQDSTAARDFIDFMKSDAARQIIRDHGYDTL